MTRKSIQYELLQCALKGITDNHTIVAYKKDCKLFANYCRSQGLNTYEAVMSERHSILQAYERHLEKCDYTASTIHRRLSAPCKGLGINMREIKKPKRLSGQIIRSRDISANKQGRKEAGKAKYSRLVTLQNCVGIRRSELARLKGKDLCRDESGYLCVRVERGKGGKEQLQRVLVPDIDLVKGIFASVADNQKVFSSEEMKNKIDLHSIRREQAQRAYSYYLERIRGNPGYRAQAKRELIKRYAMYNKSRTEGKPVEWLEKNVKQGLPYYVRGDNRSKAIAQNKSIEYDRLALLMVSVFHLSHWRLDVTVTNYMI